MFLGLGVGINRHLFGRGAGKLTPCLENLSFWQGLNLYDTNEVENKNLLLDFQFVDVDENVNIINKTWQNTGGDSDMILAFEPTTPASVVDSTILFPAGTCWKIQNLIINDYDGVMLAGRLNWSTNASRLGMNVGNEQLEIYLLNSTTFRYSVGTYNIDIPVTKANGEISFVINHSANNCTLRLYNHTLNQEVYNGNITRGQIIPITKNFYVGESNYGDVTNPTYHREYSLNSLYLNKKSITEQQANNLYNIIKA